MNQGNDVMLDWTTCDVVGVGGSNAPTRPSAKPLRTNCLGMLSASFGTPGRRPAKAVMSLALVSVCGYDERRSSLHAYDGPTNFSALQARDLGPIASLRA